MIISFLSIVGIIIVTILVYMDGRPKIDPCPVCGKQFSISMSTDKRLRRFVLHRVCSHCWWNDWVYDDTGEPVINWDAKLSMGGCEYCGNHCEPIKSVYLDGLICPNCGAPVRG